MKTSMVDKIIKFLRWDNDIEEDLFQVGSKENKNIEKISKEEVNEDMFPKILIVDLKSFDQVRKVTKFLKKRNIVIITLESIDNYEESQRIIDFICGTADALNSYMQKIGEQIFIVAPINIKIGYEIFDEEVKEDEETVSSSVLKELEIQEKSKELEK